MKESKYTAQFARSTPRLLFHLKYIFYIHNRIVIVTSATNLVQQQKQQSVLKDKWK